MINVDHLVFRYGKKLLFNNLNLNVEMGSIYGLLGKNGAGKTTLLKLISGQLKAGSGKISVMEYTPRKREAGFLSKVIYISEKFYLPAISAETYKKNYKVFYPGFDEDYFYNCLKEFNVDRDKKLNAMSYGQQKKFLLGFAFASMCPLVLMDEPTNGLDIPSKKEFRKVLINGADKKRTFIISTHQVKDLENLIDPIIILDDGKIIFNHHLEKIKSCLSVFNTKDRELAESSLYSEISLQGYTVVTEKKADEDTGEQVDIETLFNIVISNPCGIQRIFGKGDAK